MVDSCPHKEGHFDFWSALPGFFFGFCLGVLFFSFVALRPLEKQYCEDAFAWSETAQDTVQVLVDGPRLCRDMLDS